GEIRALDREVRADLGDFAELGLWADRIRSDPDWQRSAPWHYMNVETDASGLADARRAIRAHAHPAQGDVLWAIEHFSALLADDAQSPSTRADALRLVVHFIVDIHQPLHVGRAGDRGGNEIDVRFGATVTNLHRFWDTDVIELRGWSPQRYARFLAAQESGTTEDADAVTWAAESLVLRTRVYAGLKHSGVRELSTGYLLDAQAVTERRLVAAGRRLASTLNRLLCP
ncbi:MAG TPA: S1/P1 nuclease, partial [Gammaproteobacteria bacterium]|nr:S1/P1 nuclease [Gammaproteobacteria bacterium]